MKRVPSCTVKESLIKLFVSNLVFCCTAEMSLVIQCRLRAPPLSPARGYLLWAGGSSQQCRQLAQTPNHPPASPSVTLQGALATGTNICEWTWHQSTGQSGTEQRCLSAGQSEVWHTHHPPSPVLTLCVPSPACPLLGSREASHRAGSAPEPREGRAGTSSLSWWRWMGLCRSAACLGCPSPTTPPAVTSSGGVMLLNLLGWSGSEATEEVAGAQQSIPRESVEIAAAN